MSVAREGVGAWVRRRPRVVGVAIVVAVGLAWTGGVAAQDVGPGASVNPLTRLARVDPAPWSAPVEEVLDAGGYAYLRVRGQWIATLNDGFQVGQPIEVRPMGMIRGWRSRRLDRELGDVVFAAVDAVDHSSL